MPDPTDSMTLSSLRQPTPREFRSVMAHFDDDEDSDSESVTSTHSDGSFVDLEGATTTDESRVDDDFDFVSEDDETGDEL